MTSSWPHSFWFLMCYAFGFFFLISLFSNYLKLIRFSLHDYNWIDPPYKSDINGELVSKDSIKVDDELKYRTPKGKIVYGGGGIIPDVFVSIDTINRFSNALYGGLNDYIFKYIDNHRTKMSKWELYDFVENFDKDSKILNEYINQLDLNTPISPKSRENLKVYFNALMARNLFDETGYFIVTQKKDRMILKVLELESKK